MHGGALKKKASAAKDANLDDRQEADFGTADSEFLDEEVVTEAAGKAGSIWADAEDSVDAEDPDEDFEPDITEGELEADAEDAEDAEEESSGDDMTNFMSKERLRKMNEKFLKDEAELPFNSNMWVYSDWNYLDYPKQYSKNWWWTWFVAWAGVVLNGFRFFSTIDGQFYYYNMGRNLAVWIGQTVFLINRATGWNVIPNNAKAWSWRGGPVPKPKNWKWLDQRPNSWSRPNIKKVMGY